MAPFAPSRPTPSLRALAALALAAPTLALLALCGCTALAPASLPSGTPIADARNRLAAPVAEYPLPAGGTRLEFPQGIHGREKHMLDFDASGRLVATRQVLTESNLARMVPGTSRDEVRLQVGRPADISYVPRQKLQVWNYRFAGADCVWFQISISDLTNLVTEASTGLDPVCDGPSERQ